MAPKKSEKQAAHAEKPAPAKDEKAPNKAEKPSKKDKKGTDSAKDDESKDNNEKHVPRPNKEQYEQRIEGVMGKIEKKKQEIAEIIEKIDSKNQGKEQYDSERKVLFDQLQANKTVKNNYFDQKKAILDSRKADKEQHRNKKQELNKLEKCDELNEESIDARIRELEMGIAMGSLGDIKAEKKAMVEISKLKRKKPEAIAHGKRLGVLRGEVEGGNPSAATSDSQRNLDLDQLTEKLTELQAEQAKISAQLDKLKEDKEKRMSKLEPLIKQRGSLRDELSALMEEKQGIIEERKKAYDRYKQYQAKLEEEKKARWAAEAESYRLDMLAREAERELAQPNPHLEDMLVLEQTIDYCKGLLPSQQQQKEEQKEINHDLPKGTSVLSTKKERSEEMYFNATKGKKGKKGMKQLPQLEGSQDVETATKKKNAQSIKHTAESLSIYKQLGVSTPMFVGDLPEVVKQLQSKLEDFQEMTRKWEEERRAKIEEAKMKKEGEGVVEA